MVIQPLADIPEAIPVLAQWFHREWYCFDGRSQQTIEVQLTENFERNRIPITFLAMNADQIIGTVSIDKSDLPRFDHLSPWLASLYVIPEARAAGVGTALICHAQRFAASHRIDRLYLWTPGPIFLYERCGWTVCGHTHYNSHPIILMFSVPPKVE